MRVVLDGVGHHFPTTDWLFRRVSHCFESGTTTAVVGPSGSGKSTLLSIIAGALRPTEGTARREDVSRVRWVFQNPFGVPRRPAIDHVILPLLVDSRDRHAAHGQALDIMARFGLSGLADRPFSQLSGGEAQRLMLARAFASQPDLLLVDEPTAQLDHHAAQMVADVLSHLAVSGVIVAVATHDPLARAACQSTLDLTDYAV